MSKMFVVLIGLLSFNEGIAQHFLRAYDQKLDSLYRVLIEDPESVQKQQEFLDCFPANFEDFQKTYGYDPGYSKNDPMYELSPEHIFKGLARLNKLSDTVYYTRLIHLSIGGKWDADAVNYLQSVLQEKVEQQPALVFALLSKYPLEKIYSFWYFYFNSLHPLKGGIPGVLLQMKSAYPSVFQEMQKAFKASDGQAICG